MPETIEWYPWEAEHATRVLQLDGRKRVVCRCGFRTHWYNSIPALHQAVNRHAHNVALQNVS